ncbi:MAG: hypothetical protein M3036_09405, partial [Bifidobacteriales bacterium]|nr:hypothetical protein [Bifidobacteriales bacterium]
SAVAGFGSEQEDVVGPVVDLDVELAGLVDAGLVAQAAQDLADEFRHKCFNQPRSLSDVASSRARSEV